MEDQKKKSEDLTNLPSLTSFNQTTSKSINKFRKRIKFISLGSIVFNLVITALQLYLIFNRFKLLNDLSISFLNNKSSLALLSNQQKLNNSIIVNTFLLTFSLIFTLINLFISSIKLGIYTHDNFKLGINFDKTKLNDLSLYKASNSSNSSPSPCSTSLVSEDSSVSKQRLTKSSSSFNYIRKSKICFLKKPSYWSELPPIGSCFHILSALFILIAEVQLNSKRIQIGNKPIGDIFSSKLDFLIGEPINRLKTFRSTLEVSRLGAKEETALNNILSSKDDFSLFGQLSPRIETTSLEFVISSNTISLDYLNFIISLLLFILKLSQIFWFTSLKFSLVSFTYNIMISLLIVISYCSYEILFKSNNLKEISKNFLFYSYLNKYDNKNSKYDQLSSINLMDDYGHDLILSLVYILSLFILMLNSYLIVKYGFNKFKSQKSKFEKNILNYFQLNDNKFNNQMKKLNDSNSLLMDKEKVIINLDKSDSSSSTKSQTGSASSTTLNSLDESQNTDQNNKQITSCKTSYLKFANMYRENIISSVLFLVYCLIRSLFIYELFILYKYTNDILQLLNIVIELTIILTWILVLILITTIENWDFKIHDTYKLIYWNLIYTFKSKRTTNMNNKNIFMTNSESKILLSTSLNSQKSFINNNQMDTNGAKADSNLENFKSQIDNQYISSNSKTTPGLLVRDDSALNRSSYLSSSSITEVSSLMPSFNLINNSNLNFTNKNNNILNASNFALINNLNQNKSSENLSTILSTKDTNILIENEEDAENDEKNYKKINFINKNNNEKLNIDNENDMELIAKKRSYSCRPFNSRANNPHRTSLAISKATITTIGELMEDNLNQTNKNCPISVIHKTLNIIDSASSSSATVDSGRESITESPVSNLNSISKQQIFQSTNGSVIYNQNLPGNSNNNASQIKKKKCQTVQLKQSSNLLDTNC